MDIYLWLDDMRTPPSHADCGVVWTWAKTANEAIKVLQTGEVVFASLDHDLSDEHYLAFFKEQAAGVVTDQNEYKEKTGFTVLSWIEEHDVWPSEGVRIHTANTARGPVMLQVVERQYGRTFQYIWTKT